MNGVQVATALATQTAPGELVRPTASRATSVRYRLEDFIVGDTNRMAYNAAPIEEIAGSISSSLTNAQGTSKTQDTLPCKYIML